MSNKIKRDVIIPCDFPNAQVLKDFLDKFKNEQSKPYVKIGMELYYSEGPDIVRYVKSQGHKVFLDLKLHDIPNTVKSTMKVISRLNVDMTNLHAAGGITMMNWAIEGLIAPDGTRPLLIAVTQLTSTSQEIMRDELLINRDINDVVLAYAKNAKVAGLDGVVCSPLESPIIHNAIGEDFLTITPGVRFADGEAGDQARIATPAGAKELGSNYIVVGRPITGAPNPVEAYNRCIGEFS